MNIIVTHVWDVISVIINIVVTHMWGVSHKSDIVPSKEVYRGDGNNFITFCFVSGVAVIQMMSIWESSNTELGANLC